MTDSEKFVVIRWDHFSPFSERVVFETTVVRILMQWFLENPSLKSLGV